MKHQRLPYTTSTAGGATVYAEGASSPNSAVDAKLYAVLYKPGTTDTGATVTLTCEADGVSKPLLTKTTAGTSNVWFYPRDLLHGVADGAALTGTAGGDRACPIVSGAFKLVIASGGSVKTGSVTVYYEE